MGKKSPPSAFELQRRALDAKAAGKRGAERKRKNELAAHNKNADRAFEKHRRRVLRGMADTAARWVVISGRDMPVEWGNMLVRSEGNLSLPCSTSACDAALVFPIPKNPTIKTVPAAFLKAARVSDWAVYGRAPVCGDCVEKMLDAHDYLAILQLINFYDLVGMQDDALKEEIKKRVAAIMRLPRDARISENVPQAGYNYEDENER